MTNPKEIKELFEIIDDFADKNQKDIFALNRLGDFWARPRYTGAWIDEEEIQLIYDEYWRYGGHERYKFDIPLEYLNNLDSWLEDLRCERDKKEEIKKLKEKEKLQERVHNSLGSGI